MISDELRELLSAYVDGELPHADAARVEDSAKRDPRLRRHIHAYRRLSDTLRVWDAEENAVEPSAQVRDRALARVLAFQSERDAERAARMPAAWLTNPWAVAAALMVAVSVGIVLAAGARAPGAIEVASRGEGIVLDPVESYDALVASVEVPEPLARIKSSTRTWQNGAIESVIRDETKGLLIETDGEFVRWSRRALEIDNYIRNLPDEFEARRRGLANGRIPERNSEAASNRVLVSILTGYESKVTPFESMLSLSLKATADSLPATRAAPAYTEAASKFVLASELSGLHDIRVKGGDAVLTLAGEVWIEPLGDAKSERVGRVRVVTGTSWIRRGELVPMAWANDREADPKADLWRLRAESFVLGPQARRKLLGKSGNDAALLAWLRSQYGAGGIVAAARKDAAKRRSTIERMVRALATDKQANGFAVYDEDGVVLGTELFATHALMVEFAPRLLAGYLLEAGDRVRLGKPQGNARQLQKAVDRFLGEQFPRQVKSLVTVGASKDAVHWPKAMRRVDLQTPTREVVGHGLFIGDSPVHLTIFGE